MTKIGSRDGYSKEPVTVHLLSCSSTDVDGACVFASFIFLKSTISSLGLLMLTRRLFYVHHSARLMIIYIIK